MTQVYSGVSDGAHQQSAAPPAATFSSCSSASPGQPSSLVQPAQLFLPLCTAATLMSPLFCKKPGAPCFMSPPTPRNHTRAVLDWVGARLTGQSQTPSEQAEPPSWSAETSLSTSTTAAGSTVTKGLAAATTSPFPPQAPLHFFFPMLQTELSPPCHTRFPRHSACLILCHCQQQFRNALTAEGLGGPARPPRSPPTTTPPLEHLVTLQNFA